MPKVMDRLIPNLTVYKQQSAIFDPCYGNFQTENYNKTQPDPASSQYPSNCNEASKYGNCRCSTSISIVSEPTLISS